MEGCFHIYSLFKNAYGKVQPLYFDHHAKIGPGVPKSIVEIKTVHRREAVGAVAIGELVNYVVTGDGKGFVKIWATDQADSARPITQFKVGRSYEIMVRCIKLLPKTTRLVVGGDDSHVSVWDYHNEPQKVSEITLEDKASNDIAYHPDSQLCYVCGSGGSVVVWDFRCKHACALLQAHAGGATCVDISRHGTQLWTGGMDSHLRSWDTRIYRELMYQAIPSRIFSLACSPIDDVVAVGMENCIMELTYVTRQERFIIQHHEDSITSLKFAASGRWFLSTGEDNLLNMWRIPTGVNVYQTREATSVWCSDISSDEKIIVSGSRNGATIYKVIY